jgi:RNA polymerase sigma-70 factor (ECF subfamily)
MSVMPGSEEVRTEYLLLRCRRGDPTALAELVGHWERRLLYYVRRLVGEEAAAWDVLQQTWIRILPALGRLRDPGKFAPWLYRAARNTGLNYLRASASYDRQLDSSADLADIPMAGESLDLTSLGAEAVHDALDRLELRHREVLTLVFLQDLSLDEVAEVLGVPVGTVKSRVHYAKRAMRAAMIPREATNE